MSELTLDRGALPAGEVTEDLIVHLSRVELIAESVKDGEAPTSVELGDIASTYVRSVDPSVRGTIAFVSERLKIPASTDDVQLITVVVVRTGDCSEQVVVSYHTEELSGVEGYHYGFCEGKAVFAPGDTEALIEIMVLPFPANRRNRSFMVMLEDLEGSADFDPDDDGGEDMAILTITIENRNPVHSCLWYLDGLVSLDGLKYAWCEWVDNVKGSPFVNGSLEEQKEATAMDWVFHIIALPWKLIFVFVPPTSYFGGWWCFVTCLLYIAALTGIIADLAELFGCVLKINNIITAITFVALGTSMPDLFASRSAAVDDDTADASVVNVTGSNSVNVFLGLGMPWIIGAVYWAIVGKTPEWKARYDDMGFEGHPFVVKANNLGFSVASFSFCCIAGLGILIARRKFLGCELGGPRRSKAVCAISFILLWLGWLFITIWRVTRWGKASAREEYLVIGLSCTALALDTFFAYVVILCDCRQLQLRQSQEEVQDTVETADATDAKARVSLDSDDGHVSGGPREGEASVKLEARVVLESEDERQVISPGMWQLAEARPARGGDRVFLPLP
jgi:Ca2+/Na+ antiporter